MADPPTDYGALRRLWSSQDRDERLTAGRDLLATVPPPDAPRWAASVLDVCRRRARPIAEVVAVHDVALSQARWHEAHAAFGGVRSLLLQAEAQGPTDPPALALLYVAEIVAKITCNATRPPAPFDAHAAWWLAANARDMVDLEADPDFEIRVWHALAPGDPSRGAPG